MCPRVPTHVHSQAWLWLFTPATYPCFPPHPIVGGASAGPHALCRLVLPRMSSVLFGVSGGELSCLWCQFCLHLSSSQLSSVSTAWGSGFIPFPFCAMTGSPVPRLQVLHPQQSFWILHPLSTHLALVLVAPAPPPALLSLYPLLSSAASHPGVHFPETQASFPSLKRSCINFKNL